MPHNILVIDDEERIREVIIQKLSQSGYQLHQAENGKEGVKVVKRECIDLVITDILMPEQEGIETVLYLKKNNPEIKIITISAPSNNNYLKITKHLGAERSFEKPLNLADLADTVAELLEDEYSANHPLPKTMPSDR